MAEMAAKRMEARIGEMAGDKASKIAQQFGDRLKQGANKFVTDALEAKLGL